MREIAGNHSGYYLAMDREPAPTLISNGFTDDIFPVDEAVRYVNKVKSRFPGARAAQLHFDYGHQRGQNKPADAARLQAAIDAWFDRHVKGSAVPTASGAEALPRPARRASLRAGRSTAQLARPEPRRGAVRRAGSEDGALGPARSAGGPRGGSDSGREQPVRIHVGGRSAGDRHLPAAEGRRTWIHASRLTHRDRRPGRHGPARGRCGPPMGREPRRLGPDAGRPRRLPSGRIGTAGVSAASQRLARRARAHPQTRAARRRGAHRPSAQRRVHRGCLEPRASPSHRRPSGSAGHKPAGAATCAVRTSSWRYPRRRHPDGTDRCEPPAPRPRAAGGSPRSRAPAPRPLPVARARARGTPWGENPSADRLPRPGQHRYPDTRKACGPALGAGAPRLSLCPPSWLSACPPGAFGAPPATAPRRGTFPRKRGAAAGASLGARAAPRAQLNTATVLPMRVSTHQDHPIRRNVT